MVSAVLIFALCPVRSIYFVYFGKIFVIGREFLSVLFSFKRQDKLWAGAVKVKFTSARIHALPMVSSGIVKNVLGFFQFDIFFKNYNKFYFITVFSCHRFNRCVLSDIKDVKKCDAL